MAIINSELQLQRDITQDTMNQTVTAAVLNFDCVTVVRCSDCAVLCCAVRDRWVEIHRLPCVCRVCILLNLFDFFSLYYPLLYRWGWRPDIPPHIFSLVFVFFFFFLALFGSLYPCVSPFSSCFQLFVGFYSSIFCFVLLFYSWICPCLAASSFIFFLLSFSLLLYLACWAFGFCGVLV